MPHQTIKVAVIDSGVDKRHSFLKKYVQRGVCFRLRKGKIGTSKDCADRIGHGTACAGIIRSYCPSINLYPVKVFNKELITSSNAIIAALEWCMKHRMQLVNVSLGAAKCSNIECLRHVCRKAGEKGMFIVSVNAFNDGAFYPASFPEVFGVKASNNLFPFPYVIRNGEKPEYWAYGGGQMVCWLNNTYEYIYGSSLAVAHLTGYMCKLLSTYDIDNVNNMKELLKISYENFRHRFENEKRALSCGK